VTLRHLAPAGSPISLADVWRWALAASKGAANRTGLEATLGERFGTRAFLTCTGRAGLTVLLRAMHRLSPGRGDEVIVPAYTCYSVPASIIRAGLRPRVVDIDPATLDYDPAALAGADCRRVLAIVATNLYGCPNDLPHLEAFARERDLLVVDDAAQAMGAAIGNRSSGTFGDAGLFSFDKGKNVAAIDGGVLVTRSEALAEALAAEVAHLAEPPRARRAEHVLKGLVYAALLHPRLYWIPNAIPQLGLGATAFTTEFAIEAADPTLSALAAVMLPHLEDFAAHRRRIFDGYLDALRGVAGVTVVVPPPGRVSAALRAPVLVADADRRAVALQRLVAAGIGASGSYPSALVDVPDLRRHLANDPGDTPGGRLVAARIVTLPTHPSVTLDDVRRAAAILRQRSVPAPAAAALGSPMGR
jgi:perosamine synthetase